MRSYGTRFCPTAKQGVVITLSAALVLITSPTQGQSPPDSAPVSRVDSNLADPVWWNTLLAAMKVMYRILGSNPQELDALPTMEAKVAAVSNLYAQNGLPTGMSEADRALLIAAVPVAFATSSQMEGYVGASALAQFRLTLTDIWAALGEAPAAL